jgi:RNA polymerase-binding transcription factor DksA
MPFTKDDLKQYEEKLKALKNRLEKKLSEFAKNPEFGSDVDHFEEEADEAEETANRLDIEEMLKSELEEVENALQRLENNAYGRCENCGNEIDKKLLEINPESRFCKSCKLAGIE